MQLFQHGVRNPFEGSVLATTKELWKTETYTDQSINVYVVTFYRKQPMSWYIGCALSAIRVCVLLAVLPCCDPAFCPNRWMPWLLRMWLFSHYSVGCPALWRLRRRTDDGPFVCWLLLFMLPLLAIIDADLQSNKTYVNELLIEKVRHTFKTTHKL